MPFFVKKPVKIEARLFTGSFESVAEIEKWMKNYGFDGFLVHYGNAVIVPTPEGDHRANAGDWIIKDVKNKFYPCKPDIFQETYQPAN